MTTRAASTARRSPTRTSRKAAHPSAAPRPPQPWIDTPGPTLFEREVLDSRGSASRPARRPSRWPGGALFAPHDDAATAPFRFWLWRLKPNGDPRNRVAFVGLNPSTADVEFDDATIRKCIGFAERWGFDALDMVNLWPLRSTDPRALLVSAHALSINYPPSRRLDPLSDHDRIVAEVFRRDRRVVAAWGSNVAVVQNPKRVPEVLALVPAGVELVALRLTKGGHPTHPLYVPYDATLVPLPPVARGAQP